MKIIVENETGLVKYALDDDKPVEFTAGQINVGDPESLDFIIADLNSDNSTLYENVTDVPADWIGNKYTYDNSEEARTGSTVWTQDPDWVDPTEPPPAGE